MAALYRISDVLFLIIYYLATYRRRVVQENIARSFPEKNPAEHAEIAREYYRHFCDLIVESLKGFSISGEEIQRRFVCLNPAVLRGEFEAGRSAILVGGHLNNWEWLAVSIRQQIPYRPVGIYKPLSNRFLEKKMRVTRSRFGLEMIPIRDVPDFFRQQGASAEEMPTITIFGIDQSPGDPRKAHWIKFLHQDTGVPFGAEKYAKAYGLPVFFGVIHKTARGFYTFEIRPLVADPKSTPHGWILEEASRWLEKEIRRAPPYWLWSHRRWKHRKPEELMEHAAP